MTERTIRKQLAAYLEALDHRDAPGAELGGTGGLRKVLLPAALGASLLLTTACSIEATPLYGVPMPDGYHLDLGKDGPPDQGPADAKADAAQDADGQGDAGNQGDAGRQGG